MTLLSAIRSRQCALEIRGVVGAPNITAKEAARYGGGSDRGIWQRQRFQPITRVRLRRLCQSADSRGDGQLRVSESRHKLSINDRACDDLVGTEPRAHGQSQVL